MIRAVAFAAARIASLRSVAFAAAIILLPLSSAFADGPRESWIGVGTYGGACLLDAHLQDYRWDTEPRAVWGLQGTWMRSRFGVGARVWRTRTAQDSGILGESQSPEVKLTGLELVVEPRLGSWRGFHFFASGTGGLLHIGYAPDSITYEEFGGESVQVEYSPIDEWILGGGLGARHHFPGRTTLGVSVEHSIFRLDTAHRSDDAVVRDRETFINWTARLELSRWFFSI
jgi:hypothetical protein